MITTLSVVFRLKTIYPGGRESRMIPLRNRKDLSLTLNSMQDPQNTSLPGIIDTFLTDCVEENNSKVDKRRLSLLTIVLLFLLLARIQIFSRNSLTLLWSTVWLRMKARLVFTSSIVGESDGIKLRVKKQEAWTPSCWTKTLLRSWFRTFRSSSSLPSGTEIRVCHTDAVTYFTDLPAPARLPSLRPSLESSTSTSVT
jgi:hypothetical protein